MNYPTVGRLKELIATWPDDYLIAAIGVTKEGDIRVNVASSKEDTSALVNPKIKWMQRQ